MLKGENGDALVPSPTSDNGRSKSIEGHLPLVPLSEEKGAAMQSILLELEETKKKLDKSNKDLERLRTHLIESEDNHNLQLIEQQKKMDQLTKRVEDYESKERQMNEVIARHEQLTEATLRLLADCALGVEG